MSGFKTFLFSCYEKIPDAGKWELIIDNLGQASATKIKNDDVEFSGMIKLENDGFELWNLIKSTELERFKDSANKTGDEKSNILFEYKDENSEYSIIISSEYVKSDDKIKALINQLQLIIEKIFKIKPQFL